MVGLAGLCWMDGGRVSQGEAREREGSIVTVVKKGRGGERGLPSAPSA